MSGSYGYGEVLCKGKGPHLRLLIFNIILDMFIFALIGGHLYVEFIAVGFPGLVTPGVCQINVPIFVGIFFVIAVLSLVIYIPICAVLWAAAGQTLFSFGGRIILLTFALTGLWFGFLTRQVRFKQVGFILVIAQLFFHEAFGVLKTQVGVENPSTDACYWELLGRVTDLIAVGNYLIDTGVFPIYLL